VKRTKFWTLFAIPHFKGAVPPKVVLVLSPRPSARQVETFHKAIPPAFKNLAPNTLNFKPIFVPL